MKDPYLIHASSPTTYKSINKDKAKIRNQQNIKLNTGAKEIQQVNPGGLTTAKASGPYFCKPTNFHGYYISRFS